MTEIKIVPCKQPKKKDLLRLSARCKRDALVIPNEGCVSVCVAIHNFGGEYESKELKIGIEKDVNRGELARDLAGKLRKEKKVTLWVTHPKKKKEDGVEVLLVRVHYLEIEDGVLYGVTKACRTIPPGGGGP